MTSLNDLRHYYLTAEYPCNYLAGNMARSEVAVPHFLEGQDSFDELIGSGFRRSGIFVYRPCCSRCKACVAVRVDIAAFLPNRSQRRSLRQHGALTVCEQALQFEPEHYELYSRYQSARHPDGGMDKDSREQYCQSLLQSRVRTVLYEFRQGDDLVMVSIVDELADSLSSVYTFFEPNLHGASLGTYNILWQIELCRKKGLPYLYLGYWIEHSEKMAYKINFQPLEGYWDGTWRRLEKP